MSSTSDASSYTCTLGSDALEKAKRELNEDPNTRHIEVKNLKSRLDKCPGLQPRTDFQFLLSFLRARKFDQEKTFELVKSYYNARVQSPDIYDDAKPSRVKYLFQNGAVEVLKQPDINGCTVVIMRSGLWDIGNFPTTDIPKSLYLVFSKILKDENAQVNGVHCINNLSGFTLKHGAQFTPAFAKGLMQVFQDILPMRFKRMDFVNEPTFFDILFAIAKMFLKEKMAKRFVKNGENFENIHAVIDPKYLPTDLGGQLPIMSNKVWLDDLLASDAQFEEENKFGFVQMNVNKGKSVSKSGDADMQGLGGTFKKLNI
uniref:CRAL-TRIO domain-containing protein n=2 Tax=Arion vulgaris TaxID=1028688 RepID=A0A0B7AZ37_9EUPU